jgi:hypothetical protein
MRSQEIAAGFLRTVGVLLILLGFVHLAATPFIPPLLGESSTEVYQRAVAAESCVVWDSPATPRIHHLARSRGPESQPGVGEARAGAKRGGSVDPSDMPRDILAPARVLHRAFVPGGGHAGGGHFLADDCRGMAGRAWQR